MKNTKPKNLSVKTLTRKLANAEHRIAYLCQLNQLAVERKAALRFRCTQLEQALADIFTATDSIKELQRLVRGREAEIAEAQNKRTSACGRGRALLNDRTV